MLFEIEEKGCQNRVEAGKELNKRTGETYLLSLRSQKMDVESVKVEEKLIDGKLAGYLYRVKEKEKDKAKDVVIVCHGFNASCRQDVIVEICKSLCEEGRNVVTFNFTDSGDNEKEGKKQEDLSLREQYSELRVVLDYCTDNMYNIKSVIGHSTGGTVAILAAAYDDAKRIESLILIAPRIDLSKSTMARKIEEKYGMTVQELIDNSEVEFPIELEIGSKAHSFSRTYLNELAKLDVIDALKRINKKRRGRKCPILILHGDEDEVVDIEEGKTVQIECDDKDTEFFPIHGADHIFSREELRTEVASIIRSWLDLQKDKAEEPDEKAFKEKVESANRRFERCRAKSHNIFSLRPMYKKGILAILIPMFLLLIILLPCVSPLDTLPSGMLLPLRPGDVSEASGAHGQVELWWAVLALMSGLTLCYVQFINRLRDRLHDIKKRKWNFRREMHERNASWNMVLLSWAMIFMFITIGAITYGILSSYTGLPCSKNYLFGIILYSFVVSTLLRIWLVFDSHWKYISRCLFFHPRGRKAIVRMARDVIERIQNN